MFLKYSFISIILLLLSSIVNSTDYCDLQLECLGNSKHIGCERDELVNIVYNVEPMTDELREFILTKLNVFRNDIAKGVYVQKELPKASNMRLLKWNYEFEYLTGISIKNDADKCFITEKFKQPYSFGTTFDSKSQTSEFYIINSLTGLFNGVTSNNQSALLNADNYQIGCSIGKSINGETLKFKCLMNSGNIVSSESSYDHGEPCTKCGIWNEKCDENYSGLCVLMNRGQKGEKGATPVPEGQKLVEIPGPPGIPGPHGMPGLHGQKGESGRTGLPGMKGDRGFTGLTGEKGSCCKENRGGGEKGDKGMPGFDGIPGEHGLPGQKGYKGDLGYPGLPGPKGLKGSVGLIGARGYPGIPGPPGPPGINGKSCDCFKKIQPEKLISEPSCNYEYSTNFKILYSISICGIFLSIILTIIVSFIGYRKYNILSKLIEQK